MEKATRKHLAEVAGKAALTPFHGFFEGLLATSSALPGGYCD